MSDKISKAIIAIFGGLGVGFVFAYVGGNYFPGEFGAEMSGVFCWGAWSILVTLVAGAVIWQVLSLPARRQQPGPASGMDDDQKRQIREDLKSAAVVLVIVALGVGVFILYYGLFLQQ
ncbi:MAG: hypothetical protein KDE59_03170 [Anaerolineales bacterium]|nr:hypothetical protein [Anaerolineales bacterium]